MWGKVSLPINQTNRNNIIMAISTKPFHPLDAENNRRYKVTDGQSPQLDWNYSDDLSAHDWAGYLRIPETGTYTFRIQVDDNGFIEIDGKKVVEVTGSNSSTSREASLELQKGFHYAKFHHENLAVPEEIAGYPNAAQFESFLNGERIRLKDIDAPMNLWRKEEAQRLLSCYNVVDHETLHTGSVWALIGGWLNEKHLKEIAENVPENKRQYYNSCALRVSIALSQFGYDLAGVRGAENILDGNADVLGGKQHVLMKAADMVAFLYSLLGEPDYHGDGTDGYCTPQAGDIVIFGSSGHTGMCPGDHRSVGGFIAGDIWLLQRSTLDDEPA